MTAESLEFKFDKFLAMNGCDANAVLCDKSDINDERVRQFCWDHNLDVYECISSYHNFPITIGEPKFIII
jgi:hypothetical protein